MQQQRKQKTQSSPLTVAMDVFSVGVVLGQMLSTLVPIMDEFGCIKDTAKYFDIAQQARR